jgi:membrane associated rhomboid family serine protease
MKILPSLRKPFRYEFHNVALMIIGVNILVFLLAYLYPGITALLSMCPAYVVKYNMYWQFFTYQFAHASISHLLSNMIGLLFFGVAIERRLGSKEFALLYLLSGTLCGVFSFFVYVATGTWGVFLLGASGAVFAVLLSYAVLFPDSVILLWGIIPIPAPILVLGYAAIEVFYTITGTSQGVAHGTHLIGLAIAWAYFLIRFGINPIKVWSRKR